VLILAIAIAGLSFGQVAARPAQQFVTIRANILLAIVNLVRRGAVR